MRRPRPAALVVAAVLALVAVALPGAPASAQTVLLRLIDQPYLVGPRDDFTLVVDVVGGIPEDAVLRIEVDEAMAPARDGVRAALTGEATGATIDSVTFPVADLPRDIGGRLVLTIPTVVRRSERARGNLRLPEPGVYPVRVELRVGDEVLAEPMLVFAVRVADRADPGPALAVATVLVADSAPTLLPDGTTLIAEPDRQRLRSLAGVLDLTGRVPATVLLRPDLLDALDRTGLPADVELAADLGGAVAGRDVVATTLVRVDPADVIGSGLGPELTEQLRRGEDVLDGALAPARPDRTTWVGGGVDPTTLDALRDLGARQLVLPASDLEPDATPVDRLGELTAASGARITVAAADPALGAALESGPDPILSAHHLMAELAAVAIDAGEPGPGGTVLLPPPGWLVDPTFLGTFLFGLVEHPLLRPATVDDLFRVTPLAGTGPEAERTLVPRPPSTLAGFAEGMALTRLASVSYASMLEPGNALEAEVEDLLDAALSADLDTPGRQAYLDAANALLAPLRRAIEPLPDRRITLAGRRSELPLTIRSSLPYPVTVRLALASPKLSFPEGDPIVTVEGSTQVRVPVEALASGTFTLTVQAVTPDGGLAAGPVEDVTVQARVLGGFALVLGVGGLIVLASWWIHHLRTRRRQAMRSQASGTHPSRGAEPGSIRSPDPEPAQASAGPPDAAPAPDPASQRPAWP